MMLWGISELLLNLFKRSKSNAVSKDRHSLKLIWLVNTDGHHAGHLGRLPAARGQNSFG